MSAQLDLFPRHRILAAIRRHVDNMGSATISLRRLANATALTEADIVKLLPSLPLDGETVRLDGDGKTVRYQIERTSRSSGGR